MKKIFTFFLAVAFCLSALAQTTKTMTWSGSERQYLEYVPSSYNGTTPTPVLFVLHGLGDDMNNMFTSTGFKSIADAHGWIVITPQALPASVLGQSLGNAWNSGVKVNYSILNIIVNESVDDSGFLMAILDDLQGTYNVNENAVFFTGFSMGGFMSNRMAIEHGDRIKAIASVSGTVGNVMQDSVPVRAINTMHIHGTADATVTYPDATLSMGGISVNVGLGAEATVDYWRNFNQCAAMPAHTTYPDAVADGKTFDRYEYTGGTDGVKTVFIKVTGGDHDWYYTPANDIDYTTEIYNFFASFLTPTGVEEQDAASVKIYPNPASDMLFVEGDGISNIRVFNSVGQQVMETTQPSFSVSTFSCGLYTVRVDFANGRISTQKVMVQ